MSADCEILFTPYVGIYEDLRIYIAKYLGNVNDLLGEDVYAYWWQLQDHLYTNFILLLQTGAPTCSLYFVIFF